MNFNDAIKQAYRFKDRNLAFSYVARCSKRHHVVLAEDGVFLVATPRVANALVEAGYQYAN